MSWRQPLTLLEELVDRRDLSWVWVVAAPTVVPLVLYAVAGFLDDDWMDLDRAGLTRVLIVPVLILYILLLQPFLLRRFSFTIAALRSRIALGPEDFEQLLESFTPRRRWEWIFFLGSALGGLLVEQPWRIFPFWQTILFGIVGEGLAFGLLGWFFFTTLTRTRMLSDLHRQPTGPVAPAGLDPVIRWSLDVALGFLGILLFSLVLLGTLQGSYTLPLFGLILFIVVLGYTLKRALTWLFSSVYQSRILYSLLLIVLTAVAGTVGYRILEDWAWMDGLYMTIITMTTVGYGETHALTPVGRIFTMILVVTSIGIAGYAISTVAGYVVEGQFNRLFRSRRMDKSIARLSNHVILCGAGRIGREIADELYKTLTPFVIIEPNQEQLDQIPFLNEVPYLQGDATRDETLRRAGVERAAGLLATLSDDQANVFLVLSVRALNPKLRIIARLANDENRKKLLRAGADEVVHTEAIGGLRMASMMIRPSVVTFLDQMLRVTGETLRVEEVPITASLADKQLAELKLAETSGLLVMALKPGDRKSYEFNPPADTPLRKGDVLIVMGTPKQLAKVRRL